jgi:hypothetical protein
MTADGACRATIREPCAPNKDCRGPNPFPVKCPVERGLPQLLNPGQAMRRLDVSIAGGKPGSPKERLAFSQGPDGCSLLKETTLDERNALSPSPQTELVDLPCDDLERVWTPGARIASRRATGSSIEPDVVTRAVMRWVRVGDAVPVVTESRWSGPSALDAPFDALVSLARSIAAAHGKLTLRRLGP